MSNTSGFWQRLLKRGDASTSANTRDPSVWYVLENKATNGPFTTAQLRSRYGKSQSRLRIRIGSDGKWQDWPTPHFGPPYGLENQIPAKIAPKQKLKSTSQRTDSATAPAKRRPTRVRSSVVDHPSIAQKRLALIHMLDWPLKHAGYAGYDLLFFGGKLSIRSAMQALYASAILVLCWGGLAFSIVALMHWLSPSFPVWAALTVGIASSPFFAFCTKVVVTDTEFWSLRKLMLFIWSALAIGIAVLVHGVSTWLPTWASASAFAVLVAPVFSLLTVLLPIPMQCFHDHTWEHVSNKWIGPFTKSYTRKCRACGKLATHSSFEDPLGHRYSDGGP